MGQEGDDKLSLPVPPPPNPAARRSAIDAAMRKFDGLEPAPTARPRFSLYRWASNHRGAAGGLVTAALIAVISIPAIQVAIRDHPPQTATEDRLPEVRNEPAADNAVADSIVSEQPPAPAIQLPGIQPPAVQPAPAQQAVPVVTINPEEIAAGRREEKAGFAARDAAPMAAAPPPPPPPPPPPAPAAKQAQAEREAQASEDRNIVVTGSRVKRQNLESAAPVTVVNSQEIADPFGAFLSRLQQAISDNDSETVAKLVALPFHVRIDGERRRYSSSRAIYNDYERIFTPAVRIEILNLGRSELTSRDGGRLRGSGRIWFGCGLRTCSSDDAVKIREVTP